MKIRDEVLVGIVQDLVREGVSHGLEQSLIEAKKPENANDPDLLVKVVSWAVLARLNSVFDLGLERLVATEPNENT